MTVKGGMYMIQNKKGLSDIVTTTLIILLVAVSVAAIWAFVSPALRGTGTQFQKTQVCVSNIIEPLTCKTTPPAGTDAVGAFPATIQVRRKLTDGVAVPQSVETSGGTAGSTPQKVITTTSGTGPLGTETSGVTIPNTQGDLISVVVGTSGTTGKSPQAQVITTYRLPDNTIVKCNSLPITCALP